MSKTSGWLSRGVNLIAERAAAIDPEARTVSTEGGQVLNYDYLIVAPGLVLDYDAIQGFDLALVGTNGLGGAVWRAGFRGAHMGGDKRVHRKGWCRPFGPARNRNEMRRCCLCSG